MPCANAAIRRAAINIFLVIMNSWFRIYFY
ncbi:Uncharacterised protein [Segatella copri]|nr:Uncharacterised protein [Segatella copri]